MKLPLDSPRWHELQGNYSPDNHRVLKALPAFLSPVSTNDEKDLILDEIFDAIHHQCDVYQVTYVTVPWLVDGLESQPPRIRNHITGMVANIAAQGQPDSIRTWLENDLKAEEVSEYYRTLDFLREFVLDSLTNTIQKDSAWVRPFLAYYASFSHLPEMYKRLDSDEEFWTECLACKSPLFRKSHYIKTTIQQLEHDNRLMEFLIAKDNITKQEEVYALPMQSQLCAPTTKGPSLSSPVRPRSSFPGSSFAHTIMQITRNGEHPRHQQLYQAWFGSADCPSCGASIELST